MTSNSQRQTNSLTTYAFDSSPHACGSPGAPQGMGHPAQAEDLDVWVEPTGEENGKGVVESAGEAMAVVGQKISDAVEDGVNAMENAIGWDIDRVRQKLPTRTAALQPVHPLRH